MSSVRLIKEFEVDALLTIKRQLVKRHTAIYMQSLFPRHQRRIYHCLSKIAVTEANLLYLRLECLNLEQRLVQQRQGPKMKHTVK